MVATTEEGQPPTKVSHRPIWLRSKEEVYVDGWELVVVVWLATLGGVGSSSCRFKWRKEDILKIS